MLLAFSDLAEAIKDCPRGCGHLGPPADPECALDTLAGPAADRVARRASPADGADGRRCGLLSPPFRERPCLRGDTPVKHIQIWHARGGDRRVCAGDVLGTQSCAAS